MFDSPKNHSRRDRLAGLLSKAPHSHSRSGETAKLIHDTVLASKSRWHVESKLVGSQVRNTSTGVDSDTDILVIARPQEKLDSYTSRSEFMDFEKHVGTCLSQIPKINLAKSGKGFRLKVGIEEEFVDIVPAFIVSEIDFEWYVDPFQVASLREIFDLASKFDTGPLAIQNRLGHWIITIPNVHTRRIVNLDKQTNGRLTAVIRLLKRLRNNLRINNTVGGALSSYAIESLAWNLGEDGYSEPTLIDALTKLQHGWTEFVAKRKTGWTEIGGVGIAVGNYDPFQLYEIPKFCDSLCAKFEIERINMEHDQGQLWDFHGWNGSMSW